MDEEQNKKEDNHEFDSAIFIGGQHLADIREIKNHQRSITFQFLLIAIAIAGLSKLEQITICIFLDKNNHHNLRNRCNRIYLSISKINSITKTNMVIWLNKPAQKQKRLKLPRREEELLAGILMQ